VSERVPIPAQIFVSFAIQDARYRDLLAAQGQNKNIAFEVVDLVGDATSSARWRAACRARIRRCDALILLVSWHTVNQAPQLWQVACAKQQGLRVIGLYVSRQNRPSALPDELLDVSVSDWTWNNVQHFIAGLRQRNG